MVFPLFKDVSEEVLLNRNNYTCYYAMGNDLKLVAVFQKMLSKQLNS